MEKLALSPYFTIEDIHTLREYNYEMPKHMTDKEGMDYYNKAGRAFRHEIEDARLQEVK